MQKKPVQVDWLNYICRDKRNRDDYFQWLSQFRGATERILNLGCWGSDEPFALLWTFDATQIVVIDIDTKHLSKTKERFDELLQVIPDGFEGRLIDFVVADIANIIDTLPSNYFDLVYSENTLYNVYSKPEQFQAIVAQLVRVLKADKSIVVFDSKIGADFECRLDLFGKYSCEQVSEPIDIRPIFNSTGLIEMDLAIPSDYTYYFRKPL